MKRVYFTTGDFEKIKNEEFITSNKFNNVDELNNYIFEKLEIDNVDIFINKLLKIAYKIDGKKISNSDSKCETIIRLNITENYKKIEKYIKENKLTINLTNKKAELIKELAKICEKLVNEKIEKYTIQKNIDEIIAKNEIKSFSENNLIYETINDFIIELENIKKFNNKNIKKIKNELNNIIKIIKAQQKEIKKLQECCKKINKE